MPLGELSEIEIVVPDGPGFRVVVANATQNSELFKALRGGGGGTFGVITKYTFKNLPSAFQNADVFSVAVNWSDITSASVLQGILDTYAKYSANVGNSPAAGDQQLSGNIFVLGKFTHKVTGQIAFLAQSAWNTSSERQIQKAQFENFVADLKAVPGVTPTHVSVMLPGYPSIKPVTPAHGDEGVSVPLNESVQALTWIDATMTNNGSGPNQRGVYNSAYFRTKLTAIQVQAMYDYLSGANDVSGLNYAQSLLQIDSYGGAINSYTGTDTSVKQRSSILKGQFQIYWNDGYNQDSSLDQSYVDWLKAFFTDMFAETGGFPDPDYQPSSGQPDPVDAKASVDGCYINYPNSILGTNGGSPGIEHALHLYFGDQITQQLVTTKKAVDPQNFFNHAQSVPVELFSD